MRQMVDYFSLRWASGRWGKYIKHILQFSTVAAENEVKRSTEDHVKHIFQFNVESSLHEFERSNEVYMLTDVLLDDSYLASWLTTAMKED